jgi:DNA polymerase-1
MAEEYAIFFFLPFEKQVLCVYEEDSKIGVQVGHKIRRDRDVVCINFDDYLHGLNYPDRIPSRLFDVNVALRILTGYPVSEFSDANVPWKGISCLGKHISDTGLFGAIRAVEQGKFGNYSDWLSGLPSGWENALIEALKKEHQRLVSELKAEELLKQFANVEMRLKLVFAEVGIQGINVDDKKLLSKYSSLDFEYFEAVRKLELEYEFVVDQRSRSLTFQEIQQYVKEFSADDFPQKYFWESVELMRETSDFLRCIWIEHYNRLDMGELLRVSSSLSKNCRIEYDVFGTVTARILLNRPGIQYLKRTSRDIFSPNDGFEFLYADYAQFEPGILASFSQDERLIEIYNTGDVYSGLAKEIGGGCQRRVAKELFLSFVYGMTKENIRRRIVSKFGENAGKSSDGFFDQFVQVDKWKKTVVDEVKQNKKAKGPFSYLRKVSEGDTDSDIARWGPNHIIQSTASGIFKRSLCEISSVIKGCRMLVPMHDAILVECPTTESAEMRKQIESIMIKSFQETCQRVKPRISFEPFSSDN